MWKRVGAALFRAGCKGPLRQGQPPSTPCTQSTGRPVAPLDAAHPLLQEAGWETRAVPGVGGQGGSATVRLEQPQLHFLTGV